MHTDEYAQDNTYDKHGKVHKPDTTNDNLRTGYIDKGDWIADNYLVSWRTWKWIKNYFLYLLDTYTEQL
jgi:hypothetical protein